MSATEHVIRLRQGWELTTRGPLDEASRRVSLPLPAVPGNGLPLRLVRRFGCPPFDPRTESLCLRLRSVPGLAGLTLNGVALSGSPDLDFSLEIPLPGLSPRNELALELVPAPGCTAESHPDWGDVALVVRPLPLSAQPVVPPAPGRPFF